MKELNNNCLCVGQCTRVCVRERWLVEDVSEVGHSLLCMYPINKADAIMVRSTPTGFALLWEECRGGEWPTSVVVGSTGHEERKQCEEDVTVVYVREQHTMCL